MVMAPWHLDILILPAPATSQSLRTQGNIQNALEFKFHEIGTLKIKGSIFLSANSEFFQQTVFLEHESKYDSFSNFLNSS